jgi:hypothetical protein
MNQGRRRPPPNQNQLKVEAIRQTFNCSAAVAKRLLQARRKTGQNDGMFVLETVAMPSFLSSSTLQHQYNVNISPSEYEWYSKYVNTGDLGTVDLIIKEHQHQNYQNFVRGAEEQNGSLKTSRTLSGRGNYDKLLHKLNKEQQGQDAVPSDLTSQLALLSPAQQGIYHRKLESIQAVYPNTPLPDFLRQSVFDQVQFETRLDVMEIHTLGRSLDPKRRQQLEALYEGKPEAFKDKAEQSRFGLKN